MEGQERSRSKSQKKEKKEKKKKKKKGNKIDEMDEEELAAYEKAMAKKMKSYKFDSNY